ncbi:MAG: hypothetical protein IPN76_26885 [Saprospiraceae bacterium]|nr:hypothetical protein [Saprospiraceae bacterium]
MFLAAQIVGGDRGFLSKDITVRELVEHRGDVHHVFPKDLLKRQGLSRTQYNQIANYVYMQSEINIQIGNKPPMDYFGQLLQQCQTGEGRYGSITEQKLLAQNLKAHCIPEGIFTMGLEDYPAFLVERRRLMAEKVRGWYGGL